MIYPKTWLETAKRITSEPGKTVVVGECDTGKTSFCTLLANLGYGTGMKTAILDLDPGQSHIGPPTTIGLGLVKEPILQLDMVEPVSIWFVGNDSPTSAFSSIYEGVSLLLEQAKKFEIENLVVDTSGYVSGKRAERYKVEIISIIQPNQIVILQRKNELNRLAEAMGRFAHVHLLGVPQAIWKKSKSERKRFREHLWDRYFEGVQVLEIEEEKLLNKPESSGCEGVVVGLFKESKEFLGVGVVVRIKDSRVKILARVEPDDVKYVKFGRVRVARRFLT